MEIKDSELERFKRKIKRQIERNKIKIQDYEINKDIWSVHGYWNWGYAVGVNSELEKLLDSIEEFEEDSKNGKC